MEVGEAQTRFESKRSVSWCALPLPLLLLREERIPCSRRVFAKDDSARYIIH